MSTKAPGQAAEQQLLKALGHPLRQRILRCLDEDTASPSEIARKLDESLGNVSYHVKVLLACDAIELVRTQPVRGAVEHFYRATVRTRVYEDEWREIPFTTRRVLVKDHLTDIWNHVVEAGKAGGFDDPRIHVGWTYLTLDEQGYSEVLERIDGFIDEVLALQAAAEARLGALSTKDGDAHRTELVMMHFDRAPKEPKQA